MATNLSNAKNTAVLYQSLFYTCLFYVYAANAKLQANPATAAPAAAGEGEGGEGVDGVDGALVAHNRCDWLVNYCI